MKYLQNGGFQSHPLMRLTLALTLVLLTGFVVTNFLLYFAKMNLSPASVVSYYQGSEEEYRPPRSYQSMVEVTHGHLAMMALVLLLLTHLLIFPPLPKGVKVAIILMTFASALAGEVAGWLVRFVHPDFAWLKVTAFITLQMCLLGILGSLAFFLIRARYFPQTQDLPHQNSPAGQ
jgi:hypothetical protein